MAVRYPLVIDTTDNNKIKELPLNDSLNLSTNSIVNAVNITASGTLTVANLVVDTNSVSINGNSIATVALTNSYTDLSNKPSLFDGQYASLSGRPTIVSTTEDLADVSSTQATNGQALIYNSTSGVYEPGSIADAALDLTSQSISELADVAVISISTNQVLKWTGATFTNSNIAFSELTGTPTTLAGYGITDAQLAGALTDGDIKGSVFADDSTLLVDGVNGSIPYTVIDGRPTVVTDLSNDAGYVTNAQLTSGTLTINVTNQGMHDGDITGSVFGDNSTLLVDGVNSNIPKANIEDSANWDTAFAWGNHASAGYQVAGAPHDGDIEGSVFGDDSTLLVDGVNNIIPSSVVSGTEATNWNTAYSWGDHSVAGYLTSVPAQTFASLTGKPTTVAGYGITDAFDGVFASLTSKPTTLAGYGITDAANTSAETTFTADVKFDTGVEEKFATLTGSTGVVAHDCNNGHLFYHTGASGDITANFTNLGLTAEYATNLTVIINQGVTPYEVAAVQIGGAAQTIEWQGGSAPTGNANGIDSFSFTILNDGGTYVVLGQMVDFT